MARAKRINEKFVEASLRQWLEGSKGLRVLGKQRRLPLPRGGGKSCMPDILAHSRTGHRFYIVECKKGSNLRTIGHAFGQLFVDQLLVKRIPPRSWKLFLDRRTSSKVEKNPSLVFGVAFHYESIMKDTNAKKIAKEFMRLIRDCRVYLVKNDGRVSQWRNAI